MKPLNVAIAGCGPAGLASALLLHRQGHNAVLFERFDYPRPIGSGLMIQPTGLAVLDRLGLAGEIVRQGSQVTRLIGKTAQTERVVLDVRYAALGAKAGFGVGIHRASLFDTLYDAVIAAGIPVVTGRTIIGSKLDGSIRALQFDDGESSASFDLVVDALGTRTPLAPPTGRSLTYGALWASLDWPANSGFDETALEQRYRKASTMVGVLPIGTPRSASLCQAAFFWSLRVDDLDAWRTRGLGQWKAEVLDIWPACAPLLDQIVDQEQLVFARYAHRTLRSPAEPALIHLGDSWHSASPQLGQGANMALLDAWALAQGLREEDTLSGALARAVTLRRWHVRTYQTLTALFTPVYQSDGNLLPFVRDRLVGPLSKHWPATWIQAAMVSGLIGNPLKKLGLAPAQG